MINEDDDWEVLRDIHRITERRDGAVYKTEFVRRDWVPMGHHGDGDDLLYVTISDPSQWKNPRRKERG